MAAGGVSSGDDGLSGLFDASPDRQVHTSVAAETGFLLGLFALFAAPFSVMIGLSLGAAVLGAVLGFAGVVRTSNHPDIAGRALAPLGLAFSLVALAILGFRYLGVDTAFGDAMLPTLSDWLTELNAQLPSHDA